MFSFVYRDPTALLHDVLGQGDLIESTSEVRQILTKDHPSLCDILQFTHFIVITQSCDLIKRRGRFNAPYITVAAVGPFRHFVRNFFNAKRRKLPNTDFTFISENEKARWSQLLERFLNNTENEHFFLPKDGHENLEEDLLAHLRLTAALDKNCYDILAKAKVAELEDIFQAKLGWLKGNIYSRVATPDYSEREANPKEILEGFIEKYTPKDDQVWLSTIQAENLRKIIREKSGTDKGNFSDDEIHEIIDEEIATDIEILAKNIVRKLTNKNILNREDDVGIQKAIKSITEEPTLKSLLHRDY